MIGLNVGSGQRPFTSTPEIEWKNLDKLARPWQTPDILCDAAHLPYEDNSVDYVVLHHVLEHFSCKVASEVVIEAYRVLRPKGSLLVFVPNLRALATAWLAGRLSTQIYMTNIYGAYMGSDEDRHKWGYDSDSVALFMVQATTPWKEIRYFDWRTIPGADIAQDFWITGMEAVK